MATSKDYPIDDHQDDSKITLIKEPLPKTRKISFDAYAQEQKGRRLKDLIAHAKTEIDNLHRELEHSNATARRKNDQILYMRTRLGDVVQFLEDILMTREPVSELELKRWVSRLQGARDYKGSESG